MRNGFVFWNQNTLDSLLEMCALLGMFRLHSAKVKNVTALYDSTRQHNDIIDTNSNDIKCL